MYSRFFVRPFGDYVARTILDLHINFSDIFTDNAKAHKLYTSEKADDAGHARPAVNSRANAVHNERPYRSDEAYYRDDKSEHCYDAERFYAEARHAVNCERRHFSQGIMCFPGEPFMTLILHGAAFEAYERKNSPKVEIFLLKQ